MILQGSQIIYKVIIRYNKKIVEVSMSGTHLSGSTLIRIFRRVTMIAARYPSVLTLGNEFAPKVIFTFLS